MVKDLQCSPLEELGLLVSYLGPESSRQAMSIRASCATDPEICLENIWRRLGERFGSAELVESALKTKVQNFPKLTDMRKLFDLHDILSEIAAVKSQARYKDIFAYLDSSIGIKPIIQMFLQEKWVTCVVKYNKKYNVLFPPFTELVNFIGEMSIIRNDPGLNFESRFNNNVYNSGRGRREPEHISTRKTNTDGQSTKDQPKIQKGTCIVHKGGQHSTNECRVFRMKSLQDRKNLLRENNVCFRCCETSNHFSRKCRASIHCSVCRSKEHCTALHDEGLTGPNHQHHRPTRSYGEEIIEEREVLKENSVNSKCTEVCGEFRGKSCARILPVLVYPKGRRKQAICLYTMLDDQSNKSLTKGELFDLLQVGSTRVEYTMDTCSGRITCCGRTANELVVESLDGQTCMDLPTVLECEDIPDNYLEIPTPEVAQHHTHLQDISNYIQPLDKSKKILLLIQGHIVLDQRTGRPGTPFAQRSALGWTIIGDACLSRQHIPSLTSVYKTFVSKGGNSVLNECV